MSRAELAELWTIQQLDSEIDRVVAERDALRRGIATDRTVPEAQGLRTEERILYERERTQRDAEHALEDVQARRKKQEQRLYAGTVPARELGALQQEIEHLRVAETAHEEALLAAMLGTEQAQLATSDARERLTMATQVQQHDRAAASERLGVVEQRLATLRAQRDEAVQACAPALVTRYEAIRQRHGGKGISDVRGGICQGCRVAVTPALLQRARAGADVVTCGNCGRILYAI